MDITRGHWIFAAIFFVTFIGILIWSFGKDKRVNRQQFGNSRWLAITIGGSLLLIALIKIVLRQLNH